MKKCIVKAHALTMKSVILRNLIFILFTIAISILIIIDTASYNIKISYGEIPLYDGVIADIDAKMTTYHDGKGLSEEVINENYFYYVILDSSQWTRKDNDLEFEFKSPYAQLDSMPIREISFRFLMFDLYKVTVNNYKEVLNAQSNLFDEQDLIMIPMIDDHAVFMIDSDDVLSNGGINRKVTYIKIGFILFLIGLLACFICIDIFIKEEKKSDHFKWSIILGMIFLAVVFTAIFGIENASPDEQVSSEAVKYYYYNWGLPDYTSADASGSFSNYGVSRLKDLTPYYFIAGKIGVLFYSIIQCRTLYRLLNVILFFILCVLYWKKGKDNKWLLFGLILTPQLWYIFSYTTSDAWDYFISFIIVLMLIRDAKTKNRYSNSIVCGLLFALLFFGKQNYYVIALFAFMIYLIQLLDSDNKVQKIKEYFVTLITTGIIYGGRKLIDYVFYGGNKRNILLEVGEKYVQKDVNSLLEQGKNLSDIITENDFCNRLFRSFTGNYGWMSFESGSIYYMLMAVIYIALIVYFVMLIKHKNDERTYILSGITLSVFFVSFALVVYFCWAKDYQTQGRYLFGSIPCVMYLISKNSKLYESRGYELFMELICLLSLYSFVRYGLTNII